jgi:hypothetical protein
MWWLKDLLEAPKCGKGQSLKPSTDKLWSIPVLNWEIEVMKRSGQNSVFERSEQVSAS